MAIDLTLLIRSYCHLCQEMEVALRPLAEEFGASVTVLDVDSDPALEARYDQLVPALLHGEAELCHHFLDEPKVREYLAGIR